MFSSHGRHWTEAWVLSLVALLKMMPWATGEMIIPSTEMERLGKNSSRRMRRRVRMVPSKTSQML